MVEQIQGYDKSDTFLTWLLHHPTTNQTDLDLHSHILPHASSAKHMSSNEIRDITGVEIWQFDKNDRESALEFLSDTDYQLRFDIITLTDSVETNQPLGELNQEEYEEELGKFERSHYHHTDEIRVILGGSCYFDISTSDCKWLRVLMIPGDAILIPAGTVHSVIIAINTPKYVEAIGYFRRRNGFSDEYVPHYEIKENNNHNHNHSTANTRLTRVN